MRISEWGHDFRLAYLNLGRNLRTFGKDRNGATPTLIALTGTASRSVLRDVLAELDIDKPCLMENWRWCKCGPAFVKVGNRIRYNMKDLEAFVSKLKIAAE